MSIETRLVAVQDRLQQSREVELLLAMATGGRERIELTQARVDGLDLVVELD